MAVEKLIDIAGGQYLEAEVNQILDSTRQYAFSPDSLAQIITYAGPSGAIDTITVGPDAQGFSYKQTFTYTGSNVTGISAWVKQ